MECLCQNVGMSCMNVPVDLTHIFCTFIFVLFFFMIKSYVKMHILNKKHCMPLGEIIMKCNVLG